MAQPMSPRSRHVLVTLAWLVAVAPAQPTDSAGFAMQAPGGDNIESRFVPPAGFARVAEAPGSFGQWLRHLPLKPGTPPVRLFDGRPKSNQAAHCAVIDIDIGARNLQQCADAVIRLRADYLRAAGCEDLIAFHFTSGDLAAWRQWREGMRPLVKGSSVTWKRISTPNSGDANFRRYLDVVFAYAGSASLARELNPVADPSRLTPGDVFVHGGFPGHAVIVLDVAENQSGDRVFLLAQSYMPAQEIHVLRNPGDESSPWYRAQSSGRLDTPEWIFRYEELRRFPPLDCPGGRQIAPVDQ
jgi:hypothetical protein